MTPLQQSVKLWEARVEHLERVVHGSQRVDNTILDAQCPLCKAYKCNDCPVKKYTGRLACDGTTYWSYDYCVFKSDWENALLYAKKMLEVLKLCRE